MGAKNLPPTGIRSADRPARSVSLYRLRYRGPRQEHVGQFALRGTLQRAGLYCTFTRGYTNAL
jgi:hypothetical protein